MADLATELTTYEAKLPELLAHEGKFVVIKGEVVLGTFDSYQDALSAAYTAYGLEPFLVRQIALIPQVCYLTRDVAACPA